LAQALAAAASSTTAPTPLPMVTPTPPERITAWQNDPNFRLPDPRPDFYPLGWLVDACPKILPKDPELFFTT
ncbi:hypothetical protein BGZ52_005353, partial [Haplosporangium bisporale]